MKLKDLEKVTKIYDEIKTLDTSTKQLHKLAQSVADGGSIVKLNLQITDLKLKEKKAKENMFDEDGSLQSTSETARSISSYIDSFYGSSVKVKVKPAYETDIIEDLSDILTLELIGLLVSNKNEQKKLLINKLTKYKITL